MSDQGWARAKEVFADALEEPAESRASFVSGVCGEDATLKARVEELLDSHALAGEFLDHPTLESGVDGAAAAGHVPGERIGSYVLVRVVGEGGFGTVFEAEQIQPLKRRVALKRIKAGMDTRGVIARFEHERQALALMDHPGIARVYDAGATEQGRPYFVMELIEGVPVTAYCDRARLTLPARLELFSRICQAVQHAHQKGVIHRDLKPGNILVGTQDGVPAPKIIDFGIAKAVAADPAKGLSVTEHRQFIGTPEYMSPEQAQANGQDVDTRSDIYSLGVLLYELLAGATPFDAEQLRKLGYAQVQQVIRDVDPPRPSIRLGGLSDLEEIAAARGIDGPTLRRVVRGDLDWIAMTCLEKDRTRRYQTASALVGDIQRYLAGLPVDAVPPSPTYRAWKFAKRNRGKVMAAGLLLGALLLGLGGTSVGMLQARSAQRAASSVADFMENIFKGVSPSVSRGQDSTMLRALLDQARVSIESGSLRDTPEAEVRLRNTIGKAYTDISDYSVAGSMLGGAVNLARATWHRDHNLTADALNNLGELHATRGQFAEAEQEFSEALGIRRRLAGGDTADIATSLNDLAYAIQGLHRNQEALKFYQESLAVRRRVFPGDNADIAESLNNVGYCLAAMDLPERALQNYQAALEMRQRLFKGDHPDLTISNGNVGAALIGLDRPTEALPYMTASADMCRRVYPSPHPFTARAIGNVAYCLQQLNQSDKALTLYVESRDMWRALYQGRDSEDVAGSINNVAYCLADLGRLEEALEAHQQALVMRRHLRDEEALARSLNNTGFVFLELGRPDEAVQLLRECVGLAAKVWPDDGPSWQKRCVAMSALGAALGAQGKHAEAEAMLTEAWQGLSKPERPARTRAEQGAQREAAQRLAKVYEAWDKAEPGKGYDTKAADWLARVDALGRGAQN